MTLLVRGIDGDSPGPGSCADTIYCSLSTSFLQVSTTASAKRVRNTYQNPYHRVMIGVVYVVGKLLDNLE